MNKIDYENIKKEIASRTVKFENGGELGIEYIQRQELSALREMLKAFENDGREAKIKYLKTLVDDMFQKYGDDENNMIVLQSVCAPDRSLCESDPMELYYLDSRWNKRIHPVGMEWDSCEYDDVYDDYNTMLENIIDSLLKLDMPDINELFEHDDSVNECWYGVSAITKDYEYIYFIFRDDGILLNDAIYSVKTF